MLVRRDTWDVIEDGDIVAANVRLAESLAIIDWLRLSPCVTMETRMWITELLKISRNQQK